MGQTRRGERAASSYSPLLSSRAQGSSLHRLLNSDRTVAPVARKLWLVFGFLAHTKSKAAELVSTDRDQAHIPWCRGTGAVVTASKQTQLLHFSKYLLKYRSTRCSTHQGTGGWSGMHTLAQLCSLPSHSLLTVFGPILIVCRYSSQDLYREQTVMPPGLSLTVL